VAGFEPFDVSHRVVIALLVGGGLLLVVLGRRRAAEAQSDGTLFAVAILAFTVPLQLVALTRSGWDVERTLPLQLCDLASLVAPYALWRRRRWAVALTYYWGLTLTTQAVLTPDLSVGWPDPVFVLFCGMHLLVVWAAVYLTWGLRLTPTWRGYGTSVAVTTTWAVGVYAFNDRVGSNYGYLNGKPASASILDYLGEWPVYVVAEVVIVMSVWALLTWPWVGATTQRSPAAVR